jgi:radical SAM protein with 4Fe4S-binding SPASM domain
MKESPALDPAQTTSFLIAPHCYLVKGAKRGALYDLLSGKVFSVDEAATIVLEQCERGVPLDKIIEGRSETYCAEVASLLERLSTAAIGNFYPGSKPFIEKWQPIVSPDQRNQSHFPIPVDYAFLELTSRCNLNCVFCTPGEILVRRRTQCARWLAKTEQESCLDEAEWLAVVDDLAWLHCSKLQFTGGEPLLSWKLLQKLINRAQHHGIRDIYLTSNATLLNDNRIAFLARNRVHLLIQVVSHLDSQYDLLTSTQANYPRLIMNLEKLDRAQVPFSLTLLMTEDTVTDQLDAIEFFESFHPHEVRLEVLRPVRWQPSTPSNLTPYLYRSEARFPVTAADSFFQAREGHSCWMGKVAVTLEGDVLPCIAARTERINNCRQKDLKRMYRDGDFDPYWKFSIDAVETCNICEYRYACFDCRPVAQSACGRSRARTPFCKYDPEEGQWQLSADAIRKGGEKQYPDNNEKTQSV